jgi:hypothetical protein
LNDIISGGLVNGAQGPLHRRVLVSFAESSLAIRNSPTRHA